MQFQFRNPLPLCRSACRLPGASNSTAGLGLIFCREMARDQAEFSGPLHPRERTRGWTSFTHFEYAAGRPRALEHCPDTLRSLTAFVEMADFGKPGPRSPCAFYHCRGDRAARRNLCGVQSGIATKLRIPISGPCEQNRTFSFG
jgi:hypothetical protein